MTITNGMRPIHPGQILREEFILPLGLSANALAIALRVSAPRINDIARERRAAPGALLRHQRRILAGFAIGLRYENCACRTWGAD